MQNGDSIAKPAKPEPHVLPAMVQALLFCAIRAGIEPIVLLERAGIAFDAIETFNTPVSYTKALAIFGVSVRFGALKNKIVLPKHTEKGPASLNSVPIRKVAARRTSANHLCWLLTARSSLSDTAAMPHLVAILFAAFGRWFQRSHAWAILCFATLLSACAVGGSSTIPPLSIPKDQVREVCWQPTNENVVNPAAEITDGVEDEGDGSYFVFIGDTGPAISGKHRYAFDWGVRAGGLIYKYVESAPVENLRLLPLNQTDAWCSRIPKPRDKAVRRMLAPCSGPTAMMERAPVAKNLFGDAVPPSSPSPLFCGQHPRMEMTTQEAILLRNKIEAWHEATDYAYKTSMALTQAQADTEMVNANGGSWVKQAFTSNPGTVEQIQERLANALNSIGNPPVFNDPGLEIIAMRGFQEGFASGQFEVEAKLFAIDAAVMLVEMAPHPPRPLSNFAASPLRGEGEPDKPQRSFPPLHVAL